MASQDFAGINPAEVSKLPVQNIPMESNPTDTSRNAPAETVAVTQPMEPTTGQWVMYYPQYLQGDEVSRQNAQWRQQQQQQQQQQQSMQFYHPQAVIDPNQIQPQPSVYYSNFGSDNSMQISNVATYPWNHHQQQFQAQIASSVSTSQQMNAPAPIVPGSQSSEHSNEMNARITVAHTIFREGLSTLKQLIFKFRSHLGGVVLPDSAQTKCELPLSVKMFTQQYNDLLKAYREKCDVSSLDTKDVRQNAKFVENEQRNLTTFILRAIEMLEQITTSSANMDIAAKEMSGIRANLLKLFQNITNMSEKWNKIKTKTRTILQEGNENTNDRPATVHKSNETNGLQVLQSSSGRKRKLSSKLADSVVDDSSSVQDKKTASRSIGSNKGVQKKKIKLKKKSSSLSVLLDKVALEEVPKESDRVTVTIVDTNPDRIVNPLLEVPQGSTTGEPNLLVSEFVRLLPIFFPESDTFPLSYYAKLLGFVLREDLSLDEQREKWFTEDELGKNDAWFNIPPLGKFGSLVNGIAFNPTLDYVDEVGMRCDQDLDYVDPVWLGLLNDDTGYLDDPARAAVEVKESRVISKDCVSLAMLLGLNKGGVTFRIGDVKDAVALSSFDEDLNEAYWVQKLKTSHHVIIIADCDESNDIIGFIHFHFCWYPLKSLSALGTEEASLERIIKVDTVRIKDEKSDRSEKLSIILFGLALEDARRHAAWGIIDIQSSLRPLLEKYFRMSVVGKGSSNNKTLMVCDFEKCNYRFAFYTHFEQEKKCNPIENFRVLVQLPSKIPSTSNEKTNKVEPDKMMQEASGPPTQQVIDLDSSMTGSPMQSTTEHKNEDVMKENDSATVMLCNGNMSIALQGDCEIDSNPNRHDRDEVNVASDLRNQLANDDDQTNIQFPLKSSVDSIPVVQETLNSPTMLRKTVILSFPKTIRNASARKEKKVIVRVEKGSISETRYSEVDASKYKTTGNDWNIIKSFPCYSKQTCDLDNVLVSLKKHQDALKSRELMLIPRVRFLMSQAYTERLSFESSVKKQLESEKEIISAYESLLQKKREALKAMEIQQEEDDNAVCDICYDGESSGENRIIFCDSCDVSVHQQCYGIDIVPKGDYFCRACLFYKRDTIESSSDIAVAKEKFTPPIVCELCPTKGGAFVQTASITDTNDKTTSPEVKWVHLLCAKWQGLKFIEDTCYDIGLIENVQPFKNHFIDLGAMCYLCKGTRGTFNLCREKGCERWLHVTCARLSGLCNVNHGDDHLGPIKSELSWTLACPDHSTFDADYSPLNKIELDELVALAKSFPVEPKPFNKMNAKDRKEMLSDPEVEWNLIQTLITMKDGSRCEICGDLFEEEYVRCSTCDATVHSWCVLKKWEKECYENLLCTSCSSKNDKEDDSQNILECHMCNKRDGTLVECYAKPLSMKKWQKQASGYKRSMFGRRIWCHPLCGLAHPYTPFDPEKQKINCTNIIMSDGKRHIESQHHCFLCGRSDKIKLACSYQAKKNNSGCKYRFHATCARQAGLQVNIQDDSSIMCFIHMNNNFNLRAFMEDMIEPEKKRSGNDLRRSSLPMSFECAASIFNNGIRVLNCLGWAWQWAKWWVAHGDSWEPLLEEGQVESKMTKEELKIVDSTPSSRRYDARRCRLIAFSAALRNRDYDRLEGDDHVALSNALQAIVNTSSLVGPLSTKEKDFFVEWLGRVYRSKSHLLGFGDNKIPVAEAWSEESTVYYPDKTPKFELGKKSLPGKVESNNISDDIDDFFENESEISPSGALQEQSKTPKKKKGGNTPIKEMRSENSSSGSLEKSPAKRSQRRSPLSEGKFQVQSKVVPSKKGRPTKKDFGNMFLNKESCCVPLEQGSSTQKTKRKRGRPPKKKVDEVLDSKDGNMPPTEIDTTELPIVKRAHIDYSGSGNEPIEMKDSNTDVALDKKPESTALHDNYQNH